MLLAHDVLRSPDAEPDRALVFAHGILGSRNNWRSFARRVMERDPRWSAVILDLRNHGESHGAPPPHTVAACADDVVELMTTLGLTRTVIVGHSFGGKVMLDVARRGVEGLEAAWILDAPPGVREDGRSTDEIDRVIRAVAAVPLPVPSRRALVDTLTAAGLSERLAQWMTTNLENAPGGGLKWKFALETIPEMIADFTTANYWPFIEANRAPPTLHLVRGGKSDRWSAGELARLDDAAARGQLEAHLMPEAGHWLHTDDPEALLALFLPTIAGF